MLYRNFSSQGELDAEYDVERSVPDFQAYLDKFAEVSRAARSTFVHELGVRFGPSLDEHLDLFPATAPGEKPPIVVFVHGGYWRLSEARDYSFVALGLRPHAAVNVVNYSLAPRAPLWEIVRQVRAAIAWTWNNAARLGGDRDRIHLVGHSAGAHLAVMAALTEWARDYGLPADVVKGVFAISGLYDLRPLPYTFVGPALQLTRRDIIELSPMLRDLPGAAPPLRIVHGDREPSEFMRQSADFFARWQHAGLPGALSVRSGKDHFSIMLDLADPASELVRGIAALLSARGSSGRESEQR